MKQYHRRFAAGLALAALVGIVPATHAETPVPADPKAPPPIADYLKLPAFTSPKLSPNGRYFAVSSEIDGRLNLVVVDLESRKGAALTRFTDFDVLGVQWVGNERLVFTLGQFNSPTGPGQFQGGGLFAVHRDGKDSRKISVTRKEGGGRSFSYAGRVPGSDEEIFATARARTADGVDLYRLNVRTGRAALLTDKRPERVERYVLDRHRVARVAVASVKDSNMVVVHYRDDESVPWRELYRYDAGTGTRIEPQVFDEDNQTLLVTSNDKSDTAAVYRYDPKTNKLGELVASHPRFDLDVDDVIVDPKTRSVVGVSVNAAKPDVTWIDTAYDKRQRLLDQALPGRVNRFTPTPDGKRLIVSSFSDREPLRWYLLDEETLKMEELFAATPWLGPDKLVEQRPFFYKTRDGLEILGYYFLPRHHKAGERLPTVIHVHGGPWVRADYYGMGYGVTEAQLLASRGYAVVVPNFRGTTGLGTRILASSRRQWGKAMQDDIEDATDWAVAQGFADPGRICLSGASYGGYAALMGVAKTPDKYRCAVAGLAVTDLPLLMTSTAGDTVYFEASLQFVRDYVGDPDKDREALRAVSPAYLADRIKAPVLMYSGTDDIRVPIEQPQAMRKALEAQGRKVVWIAKRDEGHGFGKLENNVDLYTQILDFLKQHIGDGAK